MNRENIIIYEQYLNVLQEQTPPTDTPAEEKDSSFDWTGWAKTIGKIIDPTGISSWGDLSIAIASLQKDPYDALNIALAILAVFSVIPNLGLLVGGVGGLGFAGVKAAAKLAARNPAAAIKAAEMALKISIKSKTVKNLLLGVINKLNTKRQISSNAYNVLKHAFTTGSLRTVPGISMSRAAALAKGNTGKVLKGAAVKGLTSLPGKAKMASRLATGVATGAIAGAAGSSSGDNSGEETKDQTGTTGQEEITGASKDEDIFEALHKTPFDPSSSKDKGLMDIIRRVKKELGPTATKNQIAKLAYKYQYENQAPSTSNTASQTTSQYFVDKGNGQLVPATQEDINNPSSQLYMKNPKRGAGEHYKPQYVRVRREGKGGTDLRRQSQFGGAAGSASNFLGDLGNTLSKPFRQ